MEYKITCTDIIDRLEKFFPAAAAEPWDNPGLLTGHFEQQVSKIYVTLDVSDEAIEEAVSFGADLIVSHHPLIFGGLKQVNDRNLTGRRVLRLIENGIACFAMHTNYDVCRMADLNAGQLGLTGRTVLLPTGEIEGAEQGIGRVGMLPSGMRLDELAEYVKKQMGIPEVMVYGDPDRVVQRAAVSGGSGKSVVGNAAAKGAEVLITGDLDYHTCTDAVAEGMCIIDAGHYGTEYCFVEDVTKELTRLFPACEVRGAAVRHPFHVV